MLFQHKNQWKAYIMEAVGIGGFVIIGGLSGILLEHPDMPVMQTWMKDYPFVRRIPLGIALGLYITLITVLFGKQSGAHINPSVTWVFYRLGNIKFTDALLYTFAQFVGASSGAFLLKFTVDKWFSHPAIQYGITKPLEPHTSMGAFVAEFIISFITMLMILIGSSYKKLEKKLSVIMGILLCLYILFELPYSGMSMNPARSFAGAAAGNRWEHLWIYFVAPTFAMLIAGEIFLAWKRKKVVEFAGHPHEEKKLQKIKNFPA